MEIVLQSFLYGIYYVYLLPDAQCWKLFGGPLEGEPFCLERAQSTGYS